MLCPEVWKFEAPASDFKVEKGDINQGSCLTKVHNFYFNHLISVTIPDTLNIPIKLTDILINDCEYYRIFNLSIYEIINNTFINSFVKAGNLTLLSVNTKIDCDNCVSITPNKKLILSLTKESYQSLGLEGSVSHFCTINKYKYIVKIDLAQLSPATKTFGRVIECLKRLQAFDVILIWEPIDERVCPSSIAKYFDKLNYEIKLCSPRCDTQTKYSVIAPTIDIVNCNEDTCAEYIEWLGMLYLNGDLENGSPTNYITSYTVPEPTTNFGQVKTVVWKGFFSSQKIESLFEELRKYQQEQDKPWISMYVQGFSDSPVAWHEREHHYYTNGDNSYTFFIDSKNYVVYSNMCSYRRYNKKRKK